MSLTPYATFQSELTPSLTTANRCQIDAARDMTNYMPIITKCISYVTLLPTNPKLAKQCRKDATSLAFKLFVDDFGIDPSVIDVEVVLKTQDVFESEGMLATCFLDAGADKIVLDGRALEAMELCQLPSDRIMAYFVGTDLDKLENNFLENVEGIASSTCISLSPKQVNVETISRCMTLAENVVVQFSVNGMKEDELRVMMKSIFKISNEKGRITLIDPTPLEFCISYMSWAKTDRDDGLYSTVVCTRTGEALGLVYSSEESVLATLSGNRAVYYSRSRQSLWRKGDTSGHYQIIHRIDLDCDGDALRFTVTQKGDPAAFCHLNTLTCWGHPRGITHLENTLSQRLKDAPPESYTKRLFDDEALLRDKLVEEAQELSEAIEKKHVAEELADVMYFALVKAAKHGVTIDDAVREIDIRARKVTRRKGNSKAYRIEAGNQILKNIKHSN